METKTVTLTATYRKQRTSKAGKPFTSLGIKCEEYGDKWLSGFDNNATKSWKEGDKVEVIVEQKGEYLNFSLPQGTKEDKFAPSIAELKNMVNFKVMAKLDRIERLLERSLGLDPEATDEAFEKVYPDDREPTDDSLDDPSKM